jgi:hypothetical protein
MRSRFCPCVCVSLCVLPSVTRQRFGKNPPIVARQRLGRNFTAVTNTRNNRRIVGSVFFNVARVVLRKMDD